MKCGQMGWTADWYFCVNIIALAVYYAAYLLVQPLMNVVRCSLFNFVIMCELM